MKICQDFARNHTLLDNSAEYWNAIKNAAQTATRCLEFQIDDAKRKFISNRSRKYRAERGIIFQWKVEEEGKADQKGGKRSQSRERSEFPVSQ